jgi:hypothetical protein
MIIDYRDHVLIIFIVLYLISVNIYLNFDQVNFNRCYILESNNLIYQKENYF